MSGEVGPRYQILEKIGAGGMGVVYNALDTRLDRTVAVKTLPQIGDPKRRYQFLWEARAAAKLRHPNIVVVHDIASEDDRELIVMEYIPGGPLSEKLKQGPLPLPITLRYAVEIASALEAAHQAGIVHRDLKPSNVLITPEGPVKLVDFGLARLQEQDAERPNALRAIAGTWGYMSPEQARGERASAQSDIFSFGAVLYEMLTGKRAFAGKSDASVLAALLRDDPPKAASLVHGLPATLDQIVRRCLQKDPKRRFQHAGDLRLALEDVREALQETGWRPRFWRAVRYAAPAAALLAVAWLAPHRFSEPRPDSMPIPLTSFPSGMAAGAAWSPDGRQVAFSWDTDDGDNSSVYLMQPGGSQTRRLTMGMHAQEPAWSPDGRWIAYKRVVDATHSSLELVSSLGGPSRTLLREPMLGCPTWTPDGRALILDIRPDERHPAVLWAVWLENGARRQMTWPPEGIVGDMDSVLSPDGKVLAFVRKTFWRTAELFLLDLKADLTPAGAPRQITRFGYVGRLAWTHDGRGIIVEAHRDGAGLWQVNRDGSHARPVFGVPSTAMFPALARRPDGRISLIFTNDVVRGTVWRESTERGASAPFELVASNRNQSDPSYSHSGNRLAFSSSRSGYAEVWVADSDGSNPVQLTNLRRQLTQIGDWSPSDDLIAFVSQDGGSRQIYTVGSSGGPAIPITHEDGVDYGTGWSRDGHTYYYRAARSGQFELRKVSRSGGESELVAAHSPNGFESQRGWLYYLRQQQPGQAPEMVRRTAHGDEVVRLTPPPCDGCSVIPLAEGIYYRAADTNDLYLFDELSGRCTRFLKGPANVLFHFTLSPDAHWLAYGTAQRERGELMIVEDFHYQN